MKFRDYCLVLMGKNDNVYSEILKISESKPNILDAKGIIIATFSSIMTPEEISDYFKSNNRNFLVFDLDKSNSGFSITKKEVQQGLFGFIGEDRDAYLKQKSEELLKELESSSGETVTTYTDKEDLQLRLPIDDIESLTPTEKDNWMNIIIDKGVDKLSAYDKKLLDKLSGS